MPSDRSGIVKRFTGPDAERRLRREALVLRRLAGLSGVPVLLGTDEAACTLTLLDAGGEPLPAPITDPGDLVAVAEGLAAVVTGLHERGVLHKNINPSTVRREHGAIRLRDFDLAGTYPLERPRFTHHSDITGTLAYLAPEQTGRTGRPVDQRSDLYALGATLYEFATGRPPFGDGDPLRLVHDHLTRVPVPVTELAPQVPAVLSAIISRLLAKDPDSRYQSAEGVLHDLRRLRAAPGSTFAIAEHDFPWELTAPSRLIGRATELDLLAGAFDAAVAGTCPAVVVGGPSGSGKSALIDQLRPLVTRAGGWFVAGKFDQYREGPEADGVRQGFRAIGRLLLAEPTEELQQHRARLREALGDNGPFVATVIPEFAAVLDVRPEADIGDPVHAISRLQQGALAILRCVGSPQQPLVMVVDDLQWGYPAAVDFVDNAIAACVPGVLMVVVHRDGEVQRTHPLAAALTRWGGAHPAPAVLTLGNLPQATAADLVREMLRLPVDRLGALMDLVVERTGGNPFETVEIVNALRRGGALTPAETGWAFDAGRARAVGAGPEVLAAQVAALPPGARWLAEILCCLGGDVAADTLAVAGALSTAEVEQTLLPAVEAGLVVADRAVADAYAFRHDKIRKAVHDAMTPAARAEHHAGLAHRLTGRPGYEAVAAEQYLAVLDAIDTPEEAARVALLLHRAAGHARNGGNYSLAERSLAAAGRLARRGADRLDADRVLRIDLDLQAVLLATGRFAEAAEVHDRMELPAAEPRLRLLAADLLMTALICQNRLTEALDAGCAALTTQGLDIPRDDPRLAAETARFADEMAEWVATGSVEDDVRRAGADPHGDSAARILNRCIQAAYFLGSPLLPWLIRAAAQWWRERGPSLALAGPIGHAVFVTATRHDGYATGYAIAQRLLRFSEQVPRDPDAAFVLFLHSAAAAHWFEPYQDVIAAMHEAHERLVRSGDLYTAAFTYGISVPLTLDCAAELQRYRAEAEAGVAFSVAGGNVQGRQHVDVHLEVAAVLSGAQSAVDQSVLAGAVGPPVLNNHVYQALAALILNDRDSLVRHAAAATALLPMAGSLPPSLPAHLLQALALLERLRDAPPADRFELATAFADHRDWVIRRATECPGSFGHLVPWLRAEQAWVEADFETAMKAFDSARREADARQRPWHQAVIGERHGRFLLQHGVVHGGYRILDEACRRYASWGAHRKVADLSAEFGFPVHPDAGVRDTVTAQSVDLLAVLRASQAISSETRLDRLVAQVGEVLSALTGATSARLVLRDPGRGGPAGDDWVVPTAGGDLLPLTDPAAARLLPLSVVRYAERTREPLVVPDATRDDRFAHDPFLRRLDQCSVLAVPVLTGGAPNAVLVLENTGTRGAFSAHRLDTVTLLTGQLSVSVSNALLYTALERKVADRTRELADANAKLAVQATTDALTGLPNRRRLDEARDTVAVAMIDIDHFKLYNDHYGHQAGDECLRRIARAISGAVRRSDVVIRYGGEEFAVLLADADADAALRVAERIRDAVHALAEPHAAAPHGHVTVSIGVATEPHATDGLNALLKAADSHLYDAKRNGRDRVAGA